MVVNFIGQFLTALPVALTAAFALHLGVVGLLMGLVAGVVVQAICYAWLLHRMDWHQKAEQAASNAKAEAKNVGDREQTSSGV